MKNRTFAVSQTTDYRPILAELPLWFAWKIVLLQYRKQHWTTLLRLTTCCDLLEKSYFCSIANNATNIQPPLYLLWFAWKIVLLQYRKQRIFNLIYLFRVVICLKNRTFAVSQTTQHTFKIGGILLWFAWKIVLLQYRKQPKPRLWFTFLRCDLLEKSYFCSIANNRTSILFKHSCVVICLKNRTFAVSQTTVSYEIYERGKLWFAWKIVLLQYRKQQLPPFAEVEQVVICLKNRTFAVSQTTINLSRITISRLWFAWKIVLLQYRKQRAGWSTSRPSVVICLKNRTFAVSQTTTILSGKTYIRLWFAWKIVLLQYRKQPVLLGCHLNVCCDLLEKSYFCSIANNTFQRGLWRTQLWFAWKIVLLQYRKQLFRPTWCIISRCDLLEKSYFCSIANNSNIIMIILSTVVICLKNRTFAVSQTTITLSVIYRSTVVICLKNRTFAVSQTTSTTRCSSDM